MNFFDFLKGAPKEKEISKEITKNKEIVKTENGLKPICPYCKKSLDRIPQRKTKCPFCYEEIYVRSDPKIFNSTLLTKDEVIALDGLKTLTNYGISEKDYFNKKEKLSAKFGCANPKDIIWGLYNDQVHEAIRTGNLSSLKFLNFDMALFLYNEGKDFFGCLQESQRMRLMEYKNKGVKKVRVLSTGSCDVCKQLNDKIFTIDEALKKMPIPSRECTFKLHNGKQGWCRCRYVVYFDDPILEMDVILSHIPYLPLRVFSN